MNEDTADSEKAEKYWLPGTKGDVANTTATNCTKNKPKLDPLYGS
jgi:hypothetical protein